MYSRIFLTRFLCYHIHCTHHLCVICHLAQQAIYVFIPVNGKTLKTGAKEKALGYTTEISMHLRSQQQCYRHILPTGKLHEESVRKCSPRRSLWSMRSHLSLQQSFGRQENHQNNIYVTFQAKMVWIQLGKWESHKWQWGTLPTFAGAWNAEAAKRLAATPTSLPSS